MGKDKGSDFERQVCKKLSLWSSNFKRNDVFWRSAASGGRVTQTMQRRPGRAKLAEDGAMDFSAQAGDIVATHEIGAPFINRYLVECKNWATLELHDLIYRPDANKWLLPEWTKTRNAAVNFGKTPIMIVKENRRPELMLMPTGALRAFQQAVIHNRTLDVKGVLPMLDMVIVFFNDICQYTSYNKLIGQRKALLIR